MDLRNLLGIALTSLVLLAPSPAQAGDAADTFKAKHESIVQLVEQDASDAKLGKAIDGMLDYAWLAEASLGGPDNYAKVCASRCAEFEALLTQLIRENYIRMVRKADEHPLELVGQVEGRGGVHKVTTKMKVDRNGRERNVTVEYVMHLSGGSWQIRDIITDEVSLAKTYRHDFNKIAKAEGIDGIIRKLEDRLAKLDADGEGFLASAG
ncbi:ABC transporter substrate-binding protein [Nannocystaceae bacterium ST9]